VWNRRRRDRGGESSAFTSDSGSKAMSKSAFLAAVLGLVWAAIVPAAADEEVVCAAQPKEKWVSAETVRSKLAQLIDKEFVLGIDKGCYEAEVVVNDTTEIDVYIDPVTAEVVKIRTDGDSDS
jgi:hypothetical protein